MNRATNLTGKPSPPERVDASGGPRPSSGLPSLIVFAAVMPPPFEVIPPKRAIEAPLELPNTRAMCRASALLRAERPK